MKCSKCGAELSDGTKFCLYCETKIDQSTEKEMKNTSIFNMPTILDRQISKEKEKSFEKQFDDVETIEQAGCPTSKKKNNAPKSIALIALCAVLFGIISMTLVVSAQDKTNRNDTENLELSSIDNSSKSEINGFDSATNEIYQLAGYTVEVPKYWKSENKISGGVQRYAETGDKVAMLQITEQEESDDSYPVTFDGLMDDNDNMITMIESTAFNKVTDYEVIDTGVIKGILYKGTIEEEKSGLSGYGEWFTFASEEDRTWCTMIMCQTENADYLYTDDFRKMIKSIKPIESKTTVSSTTDGSSTITVTMSEDEFIGMPYTEAEAKLRDMGFTVFEYETLETDDINC